jgi:hypothetical protein
MPEVHLHVGLPKTGTSTIQAALDARVDALTAAGVLYPGGRHRAHRLAAYDLLGQRVRGDDADVVPGAFQRLADEVRAYGGPRVLISDEELGLARPRHVRRVVRALGRDRVHVVIGVRDMARTVVSAWQQNVMTGSTTPWAEFIAAVRDPAGAAVPDATAFWLRHDVLRVLDSWGTTVPPERILVVTVPPPGTGGRCLLDRFATATGLPPELWGGREPPQLNTSLGAAETEVVRRLNAIVRPVLNQEQHRFVVEQGLRPRLAVARPRPLRLPEGEVAWAREYAEGLVAELRHRGVRVVGDLAELVPDAGAGAARAFDEVTEAELLEAAETALAALAVGHGRLFRRYRRAFREREGRLPSPQEVLGSSVRAAAFGVQKAALRRSARSRWLGRAARAYVSRTAGRRTDVPR